MAKRVPGSHPERDPFANKDRFRRELMRQRANLIRSEAEVDSKVREVVDKLTAKWRLRIRQAVQPGASASQLAEARRYAFIMNKLGIDTQLSMRRLDALNSQAVQRIATEEVYRYAFAIDKYAGLELRASLDGISSRAVAQALRSPIPGIQATSFASLGHRAMQAMRDDVAEAIAEGWKVDDLARLWSRGAGAGKLANEASTLARTSMMAASSQAMVALVRDNPDLYAGLRWQATFDIRACPVCASLHGRVFQLSSLPAMPAHPRCRCEWEPVFADDELDRSLRDGRKSFDSWLRKRPKGEQLDFWGSEAKREAWYSGKLTMQELVTPEGRVITDAELKKLLAAPKQTRRIVTTRLPVAASGSTPKPKLEMSPAAVRRRIIAIDKQHTEAEALTRARLLDINKEMSQAGIRRAELLREEGDEASRAIRLAEAKKLEDVISEKAKQYEQLLDESDARKKSVQDRIMAAIKVRNKSDVQVDLSPLYREGTEIPLNTQAEQMIAYSKQAKEFVESMLSSQATKDAKLQVRVNPSLERSHHAPNQIFMFVHSSPSVYVHEIGHELERALPNWGERAKAFLRERAGSESLQRLADLFPRSGYNYNEVTYVDKFISPYMGKWYGERSYATEIVSMGIETLFTDPLGFAKNDPQYFDFILGLLRGY